MPGDACAAQGITRNVMGSGNVYPRSIFHPVPWPHTQVALSGPQLEEGAELGAALHDVPYVTCIQPHNMSARNVRAGQAAWEKGSRACVLEGLETVELTSSCDCVSAQCLVLTESLRACASLSAGHVTMSTLAPSLPVSPLRIRVRESVTNRTKCYVTYASLI